MSDISEQDAAEADMGAATGNLIDLVDSRIGDTHTHPLSQMKSSNNSKHATRNKKNRSPVKLQPVSQGKSSPLPAILRDFASSSRIAKVDESGDVILKTENSISRIYDGGDVTLSEVAAELVAIWRPSSLKSFGGGGASKFAKAAYLGGLLLQLHHPPPLASASSYGGEFAHTMPKAISPMPKFLLDWLNANHSLQIGEELRKLHETNPSPTASSDFWDIVNTAVLRGCLSDAASILRSADFTYARSALEDGLPQTGYRGVQLQNIQRCVNKALQVLESCPCVVDNNWDVRGSDEWDLYRRRVAAALTDLEDFAEGSDGGDSQQSPPPSIFQANHFGLAGQHDKGFSFAQSSRMAESQVPWVIYQSLRSVYRTLLGDVKAITTCAQDWVEATIGLTVWWGGDANDVSAAAADALPNLPAVMRDVVDDDDIQSAYLERLRLSFSNVISTSGFRVNTMDSVELALASIFEGNVVGVLALLQTWSLCVTSSIVEVASAGGWLDFKSGDYLNEDDLMVLSYGQDEVDDVGKDDVLSAYASGLCERESIGQVRDGWEIALEVLSRLDDAERMQKAVVELVDKLPLDSSEQMDKVVLLCGDLGMDKEGRRVSEVFSPVFFPVLGMHIC